MLNFDLSDIRADEALIDMGFRKEFKKDV